MMDELSGRLRESRKKIGLTPYKAADRIGVPESVLSKWECGMCSPRVWQLAKIAKAYGVTADWLMGTGEVK